MLKCMYVCCGVRRGGRGFVGRRTVDLRDRGRRGDVEWCVYLWVMRDI